MNMIAIRLRAQVPGGVRVSAARRRRSARHPPAASARKDAVVPAGAARPASGCRILLLGVLLIDVASDGARHARPGLPHRLPLVDRRARRHPSRRSVGTIWLMVLVRGDHRARRRGRGDLPRGVRGPTRAGTTALIELNIQNLAAVPSIVYGILGLAFLVRGPLGLGHVVLAGGADPVAARAADRDHRLARGDPGGAALDPRGLARARRDAVADDLAPGAAGRDPGHRDRRRSSRSRARSARPRR